MALAQAELNALIHDLSQLDQQLPVSALRLAVDNQQQVEPLLIDAVSAFSQHKSEPKRRLALHAVVLLAQFNSTKAWLAVLNLFSTMTTSNETSLGNEFDELVCYRLSQIFATLCPGDVQPLKSIIENASIDEYVRDAALMALVTRYLNNDYPLAELTTYLHQLYTFGLEQEPNQLWNAWNQACFNTEPSQFKEQIRTLLEKGWADDYYLTLDDLEAHEAMTPEQIRAEVLKIEGEFFSYITDATAILRQMSLYSGETNELLANMEQIVLGQTVAKTAQQPYYSTETLTGRNDPCPCGSGKKFKKCCLH